MTGSYRELAYRVESSSRAGREHGLQASHRVEVAMPTRRQFVKVTAAAGAAIVIGAWGVLDANDRIAVAIIGCGGRGQADWQRFQDEYRKPWTR
jgi:phosphate-selective porin